MKSLMDFRRMRLNCFNCEAPFDVFNYWQISLGGPLCVLVGTLYHHKMKTSKLITFSFFSFGLWFSFPRNASVMLATEDILSGTLLSSTVVLMSFSIPDVVSKAVSPFIVRRITFLSSIVLYILLMTAALLFMVVKDDVRFKITGLVACGFANGLICITMLRMVPCYEHVEATSSAFQAGGNFSFLLASFFYTGLTTWLCVPPRTTVAACIPLSWLLLVFYALLDKEPLRNDRKEMTSCRDNTGYAPVSTTHDKQIMSSQNRIVWTSLNLLYTVFPFISYFYLSFFITFLSQNSVVTTLIFPSSPFLPRDHFQYYRLLSDVGLFLGGMEFVFISCVFPDWLSLVKIRRIWFLVLLNVGHLVFFLFASWYHFVSNVSVILVLCLTQGLLHGVTSVHCIATATDDVTEISDKGTALGWVEIGSSVGRLASGIVGLFIEEYLREHCTNRLMIGRFCLARFSTSEGWTVNLRLACKN